MRRNPTEQEDTKSKDAITEEEWASFPMLMDVPDVARVLRCSKRWVSDHADELGGQKLAGHWRFGKASISKLLGV